MPFNIRMKKLLFSISFLFCSSYVFAQGGEWTWMHGDSIANPTSSYGTQGITDSANNPPGRYEAAEWTDLQGNFWMFGGNGISGRYNDLWKFDPLVNKWTWMKGSSLVDQIGIYGTQGISSPLNTPGARGFGVGTWVDNFGDLWLFGGNGYDGAGNNGELNDLWKYNIATNEWTWMKGSSLVNQPGFYGIKLVVNSSNNPKSRHETSATWKDNNGNLWLFSGDNFGSPYNDLWKYDISSNNWTWMHGDSIPNQPGVYGTINIPNSTNTPGARWCFAKWQSQTNKFYLFGGQGKDAAGISGKLNDLWLYDPSTNEWMWINGTNSVDPIGSIDSMCVSSSSNLPSGRMENRATWEDTCNNFVMFGGYNNNGWFNDLWSYNILQDKWSWIGGDTLPNQLGVYGNLMISNPMNKPCGRWGSIGWKDQSGNFWMFGGNRNGSFYYNDLWKFHQDTSCRICGPIGFNEFYFNDKIKIYPNPTSQNVSIEFENSEHETFFLLIFNDQGQIVQTTTNIVSNKIEIERKELVSGIYFFQLRSDKKLLSGKIILE